MSTLKVNTVQHNTSGFNNVVQFTDGAGTQNGTLCRAWMNFNGQGTVAIRADFNVNTIGDNGTGDFTMNFSNAMPDANYAVAGCCAGSTANYFNAIFGHTNSSLSAGSVRFRTARSDNPNTPQDSPYNHIMISR